VNIHRFESMGCLVEVGGASGREAAAIERLFQARDRQFSRFRPKSELSRVNRAARDLIVVSKTFGQMVERALKAARATGAWSTPRWAPRCGQRGTTGISVSCARGPNRLLRGR